MPTIVFVLLLLAALSDHVLCGRLRSTALERSRYSYAYRSRLASGYRTLKVWLAANDLTHVNFDAHKTGFVDHVINLFVQESHDAGLNHYLIKHALLSLQVVHPRLKKRLARSWQSMFAWRL